MNNSAIIDSLVDSAEVLAEKKDLSLAFRFIDSSFNKIPNQNIVDRWKILNFKQKRYYWKGRINKNNENLLKSAAFADSMINLISLQPSTDEFKLELANSYFSKGDILLELKNFQETYQNFYRGKLLVAQPGNNCFNAIFNSRFATLNYNQGYYREAAYFYIQEYKDNLQCKLDSKKYGQIQGALSNAGLAYLKIKMTDSAMICFNNALNFLDKNKHLFPKRKSYTQSAKGVIYAHIAEVYIAKEDEANAIAYLKKSIAINKNNSTEVTNAQAAAIQLAKIYLAKGKYNDVKSSIAFIKNSIDSIYDLNNLINFKKLQIDYFNQIGDYNNANNLLPSYKALKNKLEDHNEQLKKKDVRTEFYNLQKEYELNLLKKENQLRSLYLLIVGIFTIMLFLVLYQTYRSWINSKKNNVILSELNKQITEQNFGLQEAILALEHSELENKKIMRIIAHDLRSPLGAIASLSGLLMDEDDFPEKDKNAVQLIRTSAIDSIKLINDLLNNDGSERQIKKEPVELASLLQYCINISKYKIEEKIQGINLECEPLIIHLNREKIWRVISNLIANAVKFCDKDGQINISTKLENDVVTIAISDNGIGIPEEMQPKIFTASADIQREGTMGEQSYGIGLYISKQIIEAHGGKLYFKSKVNKGTTFYIELPVK